MPEDRPAEDRPIDLLVVGGGINGTGIARDAAGRGLSVVLCEQHDLASATSSASTKLIHGGLRYLETYEFRLVREALIERAVLLRAAPHIIWPLSFVLPHDKGLRPAWMVRLGLFLYDHLGGHLSKRGRLPGSHGIDLRRDPAGAPLKPSFTKGFCYSDCWVEDARLVVLNAIDAAERIRTRLAEEVFEGRKITVSIGAAEFPTHGESPKAVIGSADDALYEAKDSGRDRVVAAGPSSAADRKASAREKPVRRRKAVRRKKTVPKKKAAPEGKP